MADFNKSQGTWGRDANVSGACKAWVNFNGTGTVAINDSYNVSTVADEGTGDYTVNFATDMANDDYASAGMCNTYGYSPKVVERERAVGSIRVMVGPYSGSFVDASSVGVIVMGELSS